MEMTAEGSVQALRKGHHRAPETEGGAEQPDEFAATIQFRIIRAGKSVRFAFAIDMSDPDDPTVKAKEIGLTSNRFLEILPLHTNMTAQEEALLMALQRIMSEIDKAKEAVLGKGDPYAVIHFKTTWKVAEQDLHVAMRLFERERITS